MDLKSQSIPLTGKNSELSLFTERKHTNTKCEKFIYLRGGSQCFNFNHEFLSSVRVFKGKGLCGTFRTWPSQFEYRSP